MPVAERIAELLPRLRPHAQDLGCADELEGVAELVRENGAGRQRAVAAGGGLPGLVAELAGAF